MSTVTVRAPDSVTALELVQRRLGNDALILSNTWVDGQVEITASDEMQDDVIFERSSAANEQTVPRAVSDEPAAQIVQLPSFLDPHAPKPFSKVLDAAKAAPRVAIEQSEPEQAVIEAESESKIEPFAEKECGGATAPETVSSRPDNSLLRDRLLTAKRVVLCGPVGAGKSQVALQIALMRLTRAPQTTTHFFFCGTGSHGDGAFLAQKSHLLGMATAFMSFDQIPAPKPGEFQIIVVSGRQRVGRVRAEHLLTMPESRSSLVLPAGLRRERIKEICDFWGNVGQTVILTSPEASLPSSDEQDDLAACNLLPLWASAPESLVGGLRVIESDPAPGHEAVPTDPPLFFRRYTASEIRQ